VEDIILFNGRPSTDFEMIVTEYPVLSRGVRRGDSYQIAGRNGTQIREDDTFENYTMTYKVTFPEDRGPSVTTAEIARWLLGSSGFCRLEDTFEPDFYRLARYAGPLNVSQLLDKCGEAPLAFDCQPERFLKSGEKAVTLFESVDLVRDSHGVSATIHNPMAFDATPLIRFTGTGSFVITKPAQHAADAMQIGVTLDNDNAQTIEIDCKSYAVNYVETVAGVEMRSNASAAIRYLTTYPTLTRLAEGENIIRLEPFDVMHPAQLSKFEIIPRWWTA